MPYILPQKRCGDIAFMSGLMVIYLSKLIRRFDLPPKARPKKNLSAIKRARQAIKRNLRNRSVLSSVRTIMKKAETAITSGNKEEAGKALLQATKALNKAASKGVIHRNTASRKISRLTKKVSALSHQPELPSTGAA
jgi:small subunit ribosomal protein S20